MKRNFIHYRMIVLLFGIVALFAVQTHAQADPNTQQTRQVTVIQDLAPVGFAYGQSLIISGVNPLEPAAPGNDGRKYKMLFAATIFTADGAVIASSDEITLDPGEPHSFLFNRDDLPLVGEGGTGRLQVRAQVRRRFFHGIVDRFSQGKLREFPSVAELVDNGTGRTTAVLVTTGFFEVAPPREPQ